MRVDIKGLLEHFDGALVIAFLKTILSCEEIRVLLFIALNCRADPTPRNKEAEQGHERSKQRHDAETNRTSITAQ
jgi:hypothetical protein